MNAADLFARLVNDLDKLWDDIGLEGDESRRPMATCKQTTLRLMIAWRGPRVGDEGDCQDLPR